MRINKRLKLAMVLKFYLFEYALIYQVRSLNNEGWIQKIKKEAR